MEQAKVEQNENHEKFTKLTTESVTALSKKVSDLYKELKDVHNTLSRNDLTLKKMELFKEKVYEE